MSNCYVHVVVIEVVFTEIHLPNVDGLQAWFLDQFGVLHDGKQPYPGAISACRFSSVSFGILVRLFQLGCVNCFLCQWTFGTLCSVLSSISSQWKG